jgi:hypothetical protein
MAVPCYKPGGHLARGNDNRASRGDGRTRGVRRSRLLRLLVPALAVVLPLTFAGAASAAMTFTLKVGVFNRHGVVKVNGAECKPGPEEPPESYECNYTLEEKTPVTLKVEPAGEWEGAWFGKECEGKQECTFAIMENTTELAYFAPVTPEPPFITSPQENQVIESATGEVTLEFQDPDPKAVGFKCSIDGGPEVACHRGAPVMYQVSAGTHKVEVIAQGEEAVMNEEPWGSSALTFFEMVLPRPPEEEPRSSVPPPPTLGSGGGGPAIAPRASLVARWKVSGRLTTVRKLVLERLSAGDRVGVRCTGRGCPFSRRKLRARGSSLTLTGLFGRHPLVAGAAIQLSVDPPASSPQVIEVKIRAGKTPKIVRR